MGRSFVHDNELVMRRRLSDRAIEEELSPLHLMLKAMVYTYEEGRRKAIADGSTESAAEGKGALAAFPLAEKLAPYMHPKLNPVQLERSPQDGPKLRSVVVNLGVRGDPKADAK